MKDQESFEIGSQVTDGSHLGGILPTIIIDPEFKGLIPPLSEQEFNQLEENLIDEGCYSPLLVWKGHYILLDGHNRYEICTKHGIKFQTVEVELADRLEAIAWIIENQLGRRNLTTEAASYLRGTLYNALKARVTNPTGKNQYQQGQSDHHKIDSDSDSEVSGQSDHQPKMALSSDEVSGQSDHQPKMALSSDEVSGQSDHQPKTEERLASTYKVGARTIRRDAQFAEALNQLENTLGGTIKQDIITRKIRLNRKTVLDLADLSQENPSKARETLTMLTKTSQELKTAHHLQFSPGCLVRIRMPDNEQLHQRLARAGKVTPQRIEVWHRDIETMQMRKYLVKFEQVEFVSFESQPDIKKLSDRLSTLREKPLDPFERDLVELLDRATALTPVEVEYLEMIERRY